MCTIEFPIHSRGKIEESEMVRATGRNEKEVERAKNRGKNNIYVRVPTLRSSTQSYRENNDWTYAMHQFTLSNAPQIEYEMEDDKKKNAKQAKTKTKTKKMKKKNQK